MSHFAAGTGKGAGHVNVKDLLNTVAAAQGPKAAGRGGIVENLAKSLGGKAGAVLVTMLATKVLGAARGRAVGDMIGRFGGAAIIGSLAWQVYQEWQGKRGPGAPPAGGPPLPGGRRTGLAGAGEGAAGATGPEPGSPLAPATPAQEEELSRLLIRAMIGAAKADGQIDPREEAAIVAELGRLELGEADRAFVAEELRAPPDVRRVAEGVRNPEMAVALYAASLLVITVDTEAERRYLAALAERLNLDPGLAAALEAKMKEAVQAG